MTKPIGYYAHLEPDTIAEIEALSIEQKLQLAAGLLEVVADIIFQPKDGTFLKLQWAEVWALYSMLQNCDDDAPDKGSRTSLLEKVEPHAEVFHKHFLAIEPEEDGLEPTIPY